VKIKRSHFELSCALWLACGVVALGQDAASKAAPSLPGTVTPIALPAAITSAQASARKATYSVAVPGSGDWTDAGFAIAAGETVSYSATRQLTLWDARASAPAGVARGWKDLLRQFPLDSASTGALIGRIGNADAAVPFAIGGQLEQTVPANGELFLAANVPKEVGAQGTYQVSMKITAAKPTSQATVQQDTALLTPALLDGVPQRVGDEQGNPGGMVNFCIVATKDAVQKAFTAAGWVQVDRTNQAAVLNGDLVQEDLHRGAHEHTLSLRPPARHELCAWRRHHRCAGPPPSACVGHGAYRWRSSGLGRFFDPRRRA
jgi:LssY C-terminus